MESSINTKLQPPALKFLFLSEMWERFSFYGIKALLVLYIIKELSVQDSEAYSILGAYATLVYASLIIGGYITDEFLGFRKGIILGAFLITMGHISLAIGEGAIFYLGLGFIVVGTGFFKGNITSFLGEFYEEHDPRRDAGFTLFYMGINVGGLLAPILCGYLAQRYGWNWGFGLAAIGMIFGLITFTYGNKAFEGKGYLKKESNLVINKVIYLGSILMALLAGYIIKHNEYVGRALPVIGILVIIYVAGIAIKSGPVERENIATLAIMMFFVLIFLAFWEQIATSLNVFSDRYVDRRINFLDIQGFKEIPTPWLQSLNALFILLLAPIFSWIWEGLNKTKYKVYTPFKFALSFILLGIGFLIFKYSANNAIVNGKCNLIWIISGYLVYTAGELAILPIGYAMVTRLAPKDKKGAFMGVWFIGFSFAQYIAASIAKFTSSPEGQLNDSVQAVSNFAKVFGQISNISFITAFILLLTTIFTIKVFRRIE